MPPKNIAVFSDGTGNRGGKTRGTNVWRLYNAVNREPRDIAQVTFYDDGVGTADFALWRALGSAFGAGFSSNVAQLYEFLVKTYDGNAQDRIYMFGFSRGAFTVRTLAELVCQVGLWKREQYEQCDNPFKVIRRQILNAYRSTNRSKAINKLQLDFHTNVKIYFVGVWDTVDAVGMPIDEMRDWLEAIWRGVLGRRLYSFEDRTLSDKVEHGRQALSIDDDRRTFHPNVWEHGTDISQVWFAGSHSNVGGGYPKDALAYVTLDWMVEEMDAAAKKDGVQGLQLLPGRKDEFRYGANAYGRHYEPRSRGAFFYRYSPRVLVRQHRGTAGFWTRTAAAAAAATAAKLSKSTPKIAAKLSKSAPKAASEETLCIHESVWQRIERRTQNYAPNGLPPEGSTVSLLKVSTVRDDQEMYTEAFPRLSQDHTQRIRRMIRTRQAFYCLMIVFLIALLSLGLFPPGHSESPASTALAKAASTVASGLATAVKYVLPDFAAPFVTRIFAKVYWALPFSFGFILWAGLSRHWKKRMNKTARHAWNDVIRSEEHEVEGRIALPQEAPQPDNTN